MMTQSRRLLYSVYQLRYYKHAAGRTGAEIPGCHEDDKKEPESIPQNVNDLLEDLIRQSVTLVGKPVAMMTKDDKVRAIQFLNDAGAFLITKSGDKISNFFGISKYTLYSYIDVNK